MTPELHRPVVADRVGRADMAVDVVASEAECRALAERMMLPTIAALRCRFVLRRLDSTRIEGRGTLQAEVEQVSVVSSDTFAASVRDEFVVHFVPDDEIADTLEPDGIDEVPYANGTLDLGEAAAEQLALALDPYPRKPGEVLEMDDAADADNPFAALAMPKPPGRAQ